MLGWLEKKEEEEEEEERKKERKKERNMNNSGFRPFQVGHLRIQLLDTLSATVDWGSIYKQL